MRVALLTLIAAVSSACSQYQEAQIRVVDAGFQRPIEGAEVTTELRPKWIARQGRNEESSENKSLTDSDGLVMINIPVSRPTGTTVHDPSGKKLDVMDYTLSSVYLQKEGFEDLELTLSRNEWKRRGRNSDRTKPITVEVQRK